MRLPNLSVSDSITKTIRELDLQRFKLDKQISTGQKITLPEDDGMRLGRVIKLDTEKGQLAQFQRNASYASEFLNAGHLNLDNLREVNQRAQEISRVAGSSLNGPAMETYGNEINQLIEEALNRINSTHRGRSLFAGTQLKPEFGNSEVQRGSEQKAIISLDSSFVGEEGGDGTRRIKSGEQVIFKLNGREYVVSAKVDGLTTSEINQLASNLINNDTKILADSPVYETNEYKASVRGSSKSENYPNSNVQIYSKLSNTGDLLVFGTVGEKYEAKAEYLTHWDPNHYYPNQVEEKRSTQTQYLYPGSSYNDLTPAEKKIVDDYVFEATNGSFPRWSDALSFQSGDRVYDDTTDPLNPRSLQFNSSVKGTWGASSYLQGDFVNHDGSWHQVISSNGASSLQSPHNPSTTPAFNNVTSYLQGSPVLASKDQIVTASSLMKGSFDPYADYLPGDVVHQGNQYWQFDPTFKSIENWSAKAHSTGDVVRHNGIYYKALSATIPSDLNPSSANSASWESLGSSLSKLSDAGVGLTDRTTQVNNEATTASETGTYFIKSPFQATAADGLSSAGDPVLNGAFEIVPNDTVAPSWNRDIAVGTELSLGTSSLSVVHSDNWKRLETYELGTIIKYEDKLWESQINDNFNHRPSPDSSLYWKEVPSGYAVDREDWELESTGVTKRFYFLSVDGRLFDDRTEAQLHNESILLASNISAYNSVQELQDDAALKVKEIAYPVSNFSVKSSQSTGKVTFDPETLEYRLAAAAEGGSVIDGLFIKGQVTRSSEIGQFVKNSTVLHEGKYYLVTDPASTDKTLWPHLEESFPPTDAYSYVEGEALILKKGDYLFDAVNNSYYLAAEDLSVAQASTATLSSNSLKSVSARTEGSAFLLGDTLPIEGKEMVFLDGSSISPQIGDYVYDRANDLYYVALQSLNDETVLTDQSKFLQVSGRAAMQGAEWSADFIYDSGQITLHEGRYYKCLLNNFNNSVATSSFLGGSQLVRPDDKLVFNEEGIRVANYIWEEVEKPLNHVLKFEAVRSDAPTVTIQPAGSAGIDAKAKAVVDANGDVVGLKVVNPGRYFFGTSASGIIPPDFEKAKVILPGGQEMEATILWEENPNDPGPFRIAGFDISGETVAKNAAYGPRTGDTFSFATGEKTFLDHRNDKGEIINVSYMGSEKNSEFYVGKESAISSFIDSSDGNTAGLGNVVNTLVELRDGLANATPSHYSQEVENAEKKLIDLEDEIIDKMGELSASMLRMETVKAHDEDYFMQLDQRVSRDLDIDLSEAIMRLTRVSTAYQAAMQVGAQLLNSSLLNYL